MSQISWLNPETLSFPPTKNALQSPNGLLAAGGDLSPQRLISAYARGIFPWFSEGQPILWWSPDPRLVLSPSEIHIGRTLRKRFRKQTYRITVDKAFEEVIYHCANTPRQEQGGTWITSEMENAYVELHKIGVAHSVETWLDDTLVGGLYGVCLGKAFFGESMFSHASDASKVAFATLVKQLDLWKFHLIDCQVQTELLESFGAQNLTRQEFEKRLQPAIESNDLKEFINWKTNWVMPSFGINTV